MKLVMAGAYLRAAGYRGFCGVVRDSSRPVSLECTNGLRW